MVKKKQTEGTKWLYLSHFEEEHRTIFSIRRNGTLGVGTIFRTILSSMIYQRGTAKKREKKQKKTTKENQQKPGRLSTPPPPPEKKMVSVSDV